MLNNRWMFLCLLIGSILAISMVSSMPIYANGVLQRMLTRDLENFQTRSGTFPGHYSIHAFYDFLDADKYNPIEVYKAFNKQIIDRKDKEIGLPVLNSVHKIIYGGITIIPETGEDKKAEGQGIQLEAFTDFKDNISITNGRMFSSQKVNGIYEAVVTKSAMNRLGLVLDKTYLIRGRDKTASPVRVKVVGVFDLKDPRNPYWFEGLYVLNKSFIMDYNLLVNDFIAKGESAPLPSDRFSQSVWYYAFDYHKITLDNMNHIIDAYKAHKKWADKYGFIMKLEMPVIEVLEKYPDREKLLRTTLWILLVPILIMLSFYIFMVSQLIVNHEEDEVAVLKSRGASKTQVLKMYFVESLVLSGIAFVLGPPAGLLLCKILGSSNGFLEFVQRTALPTSLRAEAYCYSLIAMILFIVSMLVPVILHSRISIVQHKQKKSRKTRIPLWQRFFLDIIILALSAYGLYRYGDQQKLLSITGLKGTEIQIDPLLFLISTFFILGSGLLFLRIFPYLVRLVFQIGRRKWSPVFYVSFIQVGRSGGQEQFLMLFIILALSIGIFNANAARTINRNSEEKIRYATGADVVLQAQWRTIEKEIQSDTGGGQSGIGIIGAPTVPAQFSSDRRAVVYVEPNFSQYQKIDGVDKATKVLVKDNNRANYNGNWISNVKVMGIIPNEFGEVAWFRSDLLPYHWYHYLNLMTDSPKAVLLSRSFEKEYHVKVGDPIHIKYGESGYIEGTVYAFIDYWPTYNPNLKTLDSESKNKELKTVNFVVMNLKYLHNRVPIEPYEVWIKKKAGTSDKIIDDDIREKMLGMEWVKYTDQEIIKVKNDPLLQGTNGVLTLGFVVAMTVSIIGFLIYGILSIRKRILQFGILRAMGMPTGKVIGMIICEQGLITGTAIIIGIIIGGITSDLFVPMLQMVYSSAEQIPPFKVVSSGEDYMRVYMVLAAMIITGLSVLGRQIARIRIDQALKLGED